MKIRLITSSKPDSIDNSIKERFKTLYSLELYCKFLLDLWNIYKGNNNVVVTISVGISDKQVANGISATPFVDGGSSFMLALTVFQE